ncbi:MAG: hypothetical protein ACFE0J_22330 [Elainellaceae cyanobacterium]
MDIIQIVPRMPPLVDGIGDYSLKLADQLLEHHGIVTNFLVCQQRKRLNPVIGGFPAVGLPNQEIETFLELMPKGVTRVILHYTNYPYVLGKHDAPFWLLNALEAACQQHNLKLIVMFHELPLLKKTRYIRPIQGFVALRIAKLADHVLTNCANFNAILSKWVQQPVATVPVFSNVCEPPSFPPLAERPRRMIVFGGPSRARIYRDSADALTHACQALGIEEICDIGPSLKLDQLNVSDLVDVPIMEMGIRPLDEISELMLMAIAGFFDYSRFPGYLAKSGVFAAYCAHGLVPISATYNPSEADGVCADQHYLIANQRLEELKLQTLQTIADTAHQWYAAHSQQKSADIFADHLFNENTIRQPSFAS